MNPEYIKLAQLAQDTVIATMQDGEQTHTENEWQGLSEQEQMRHILSHIASYIVGDTSEDHIAHVLARCVMMISRR